MLKEKEAVLKKTVIFIDAALIAAAFFVAYFLRLRFHLFYKWDLFPGRTVVAESSAVLSEYLVVLFLAVPLWCFMLHLSGMYSSMRTRKFHEILWILLKASFFAVLGFGAVIFLLKLEFVSRLFFVIFVLVSLIFLLAEKITLLAAVHHVRRKGISFRQILVVGTGKRAISLIKIIKNHPEWGLRILGAVDDEPERGIKKVDSIDVVGPIDDLSGILHDNAVDEVIFVVPRSRLSYIEEAIHTCETEGIKATVAVDLFDLRIARSRTSELNGIPLITFETTVAREWELFAKRIVDLVLSGFGILILSPFLLGVAVIIKLNSKGSVLFKQKRLGLNGRKFNLYKFRTMYLGSEGELANMNVANDSDDPEFKKRKMKHITPVGRLLRKFSIDELPQLFNVFAGHMSLVGPRPTVPEEVVQYKPWQRRRLSMRPGITCLWQVCGRNKVGFEDWMKQDLEYIDNWSPWMDLKILLKTIPVVVLGIGAY
jgi:exopolysaccharide biosynthesis polyprenyl glycosylphosphotransferase